MAIFNKCFATNQKKSFTENVWLKRQKHGNICFLLFQHFFLLCILTWSDKGSRRISCFLMFFRNLNLNYFLWFNVNIYWCSINFKTGINKRHSINLHYLTFSFIKNQQHKSFYLILIRKYRKSSKIWHLI